MSKFDTWSLEKFANEVFLGIYKLSYEKGSKSMVRKSVAVFQDWYGGPATIEEVTPELLDKLKEAKGYESGHQCHWSILRTIMRTAAPSRFPKLAPVDKKSPMGMDGPDYFLAAFYANLYEPMALRSRRPRTKDLYRGTLLQFEKYLERMPTIDDLNNETVGLFAAARLQSGKSKHTVNKDLFNLLAIWRWANRKGYISTWPDVEMENAPKRIPEAWTKEQIDRLFASAGEEDGRIAGIPSCLWWTTLLLVMWDSGERIAAIRGLRWCDVDFKWRGLKFIAENRKGAAADNLRAIAKDTTQGIQAIRRWQESHDLYEPDGLVFMFPYHMGTLYNRFNKILQRADLPFNCRCKFHRIRRSVASHFEQAGGNATELLGHSKREVTKAYLDPKIVKRVEAVDLLFRPGEDPPANGKKKPK